VSQPLYIRRSLFKQTTIQNRVRDHLTLENLNYKGFSNQRNLISIYTSRKTYYWNMRKNNSLPSLYNMTKSAASWLHQKKPRVTPVSVASNFQGFLLLPSYFMSWSLHCSYKILLHHRGNDHQLHCRSFNLHL